MNGPSGPCGSVASGPVLSHEEKSETRRFCGYAALGDVATGESSWRFFQSAGTIEWRLNTLTETERRRLRYFLTICQQMEQAVVRVSDDLDIQSVSVWTRNPRETTERLRLLEWWCRRLCGFLGLQPGPDLQETGAIII